MDFTQKLDERVPKRQTIQLRRLLLLALALLLAACERGDGAPPAGSVKIDTPPTATATIASTVIINSDKTSAEPIPPPPSPTLTPSPTSISPSEPIIPTRTPTPSAAHANGADWSMAGANPARTSWVAEEVRGALSPLWAAPIEAFIPGRVQIIAADGLIYVATSAGLYAFNATSGAQAWLYPTAMPLGHSPSVVDGVVYAGDMGGLLHAIDAHSGTRLWTVPTGGGIQTNPLVMNNLVYFGSRDGNLYAVGAHGSPQQGQFMWQFSAGGAILYSPAWGAGGNGSGVLYFAAEDSRAYAVNAADGTLIWRSQQLPGSGFHSWWPVVTDEWVLFAGSHNYRAVQQPYGGQFTNSIESPSIYPNQRQDPRGTLVGAASKAADGTPLIDLSQPNITANGATTAVTEYFEDDGSLDLSGNDHKPWRRTFFVLSRSDGHELTTDFDGDGQPEYAPFLWYGTHGGGNRYPAMVGADGRIYQTTSYLSDPFIAGGQVVGWDIGSPQIRIVNNDWGAIDEPIAYAGGGDLVYWNLCCDRQAGAFDITKPLGGNNGRRNWMYFSYNLAEMITGFNVMTDYTNRTFGGDNGGYGNHGDTNPPIPYNGMVYMHRGNALLAFAPGNQAATIHPLAKLPPPEQPKSALTREAATALLTFEVEKMVDAGHLRPAYLSSGLLDTTLARVCGDSLQDYWHSSAETITILLHTLPHLPADLQARTRAYIQAEFEANPPHLVAHIGWADGAQRESFITPPEFEAARAAFPAERSGNSFWDINPNIYNALYLYAKEFGGAEALLAEARQSVAVDGYDDSDPTQLNAMIAGHIGFLGLQQLAGEPPAPAVAARLNQLLRLRGEVVSAESIPYNDHDASRYCRALNGSRHFLYMLPEAATDLAQRRPAAIRDLIAEQSARLPYWFVARTEAEYGEGVLRHLYDRHTLFQARALLLTASFDELAPYLDIPAVPVGDLYYIDNLISLLAAPN